MTDFSSPDSYTTIVVFSEWSIAKRKILSLPRIVMNVMELRRVCIISYPAYT